MLKYRRANIGDLERYYKWVNDPEVREQSFNSDIISFENHTNWFKSVLEDEFSWMYIFQNEKAEDVGQVRIQQQDKLNALIGISILPEHRGKGYAAEMLLLATNIFIDANESMVINAYIKETNLKSKFSFEKSGFKLEGMINYKEVNSFHYTKRNEDR
ncbi:MAG: GNAT family N-acetyltransferase [Pedobacter sp.]|uniref:GNAT family N-acetyltransferase n=1 Tax=Pedobacter sp. TaxID=1411316 RepID=UPI0028078D29|nr:GNAT family N-acetyltransferase [Pedobacter sp.]MDQ8004319.1 GNAT family N-acetyltransferase [Pedobacter sp.]